MGEARTLKESIHALHDGLPRREDMPPAHPFIGSHFEESTPGVLRVLVMGINNYYGEEHAPTTQWYPQVVRDRRHTYFARCFSEAAVLSEVLAGSRDFPGLSPGGLEAMYVTNMVRRYVPMAKGKRESQVEASLLEEGQAFWHRELDMLHAHGALPHVVIVFGNKVWGEALQPFRQADWAVTYQHCGKGSSLFHHLNRIVVRDGDKERVLLTVKLTHPAARSNKHRAACIVADLEFRRMTGAGWRHVPV